MDLSLIQQGLVVVLLYMLIGMLLSVQFIIKHMEDDDDPAQWSSFIDRTLFLWPKHLFVVLALRIINIFRR